MRALSFLLLVAALAACGPPAARPSAGRTPGAATPAERPPLAVRDVEQGVHTATNAARRRQRLGALTFDGALAAVARRHSADMARRGDFAHRAPDGSDATARAAGDRLDCRVETGDRVYAGFSENLFQTWLYSEWRETTGPAGTGRTYAWHTLDEIVAQIVDGWLASPGHRRNLLLGHATREGVGVFVGDDGAVFVTQMLC